MRSLVLSAALFSVAQALLAPDLLKRTSTDTCANLVNKALAVNLSGVGPVTIGIINTCLCLSGITTFEASNIVAQAAVAVAGTPATTTSLTSLVNANGHQCTYPTNANPVCTASNPCGFTCQSGFTAFPASNPSSCVCSSPRTVCNGVCGSFPGGCPSSTPEKRRASNSWQKRTSCDVGFTACGTTSSYRKSLGAYECVDIGTDLESCGGCNIPLHENSPRGQDCTSIPGVADVSCYNGVCRVYECMPGYTISSDQSRCHSEDQLRIIKELVGNPYKMAVDFI